jgi:hypothetical protein
MHIEKSSAAETALADDFLSGGGRMGAMMRAFDFSGTPLGPVADWPASLRAATSICLNSRYPMFIAWGTHRSMIYNDAYTAVLAKNTPGRWGGRPRRCGRRYGTSWVPIGRACSIKARPRGPKICCWS